MSYQYGSVPLAVIIKAESNKEKTKKNESKVMRHIRMALNDDWLP